MFPEFKLFSLKDIFINWYSLKEFLSKYNSVLSIIISSLLTSNLIVCPSLGALESLNPTEVIEVSKEYNILSDAKIFP